MLRRKLLVILGLLVALWLVAALIAIMLLDGVLRDLDSTSTIAHAGSTRVTGLVASLNEADLLLIQYVQEEEVAPEAMTSAIAGLQGAAEDFAAASADAIAPDVGEQLHASLLLLITTMSELARSTDPTESSDELQRAILASTQAHDDMAAYSQAQHDLVQEREQRLMARFRRTALGLGLTFLLLINGSILMLLRVSTMILQPVEKLVEATRRLGRGDFDCRVDIKQHDEFAELAAAYNALGSELQATEERRLETLHQVATTLNHELNNSIAIIGAQLDLMARKARELRSDDAPMRQIHETLSRMSKTLDALRHIRRIVLTDYSAGIKMIDLERSLEHETVVLGQPEPVADGPRV